MRQVDRRVKNRRDERIRSLQQDRSWPTAPRSYRRDYSSGAATRGMAPFGRRISSRERLRKRRARLAVQALCAFLLFAFTYVVFQADSPAAMQTQAFITEVMERDFNFQGVADWVDANLGGMPAIIPTFSKDDTSDKTGLQPSTWLPPMQGHVVEHYTQEHPYVRFVGSGEGLVTASAEGLVTFVGDREGWGYCVIVQHAGDMETWYGPLSDVEVQQSDWVQPEEPLGRATAVDGTIQFGVKQGGQFVNPFDVMNID